MACRPAATANRRWPVKSNTQIGLVEASVRVSGPLIPRRVRVSVSAIPSRGEAAAPGWL